MSTEDIDLSDQPQTKAADLAPPSSLDADGATPAAPPLPSPHITSDVATAASPIVLRPAAPRPPTTHTPPPPQPSRGGGWTIPLLCAGIGLIACTLLIPLSDENRQLVYERERLKIDLDHVKQQVAVNDDFLLKVADDPNLAERLAQRQLRKIREGTSVMKLPGASATQDMSPFLLVNVPPPPQLEPYKPAGGKFASLCRDPKSQLYLMGTGLLLLAVGLICGSTSRMPTEED